MKTSCLVFAILVLLSCAGCSSPVVFTSLMSGDCVDRAVKIRQDLRAKGYKADIILGIIREGEKIKGHAWIKYRDKKTGEWKEIRNY